MIPLNVPTPPFLLYFTPHFSFVLNFDSLLVTFFWRNFNNCNPLKTQRNSPFLPFSYHFFDKIFCITVLFYKVIFIIESLCVFSPSENNTTWHKILSVSLWISSQLYKYYKYVNCIILYCISKFCIVFS